MTHSRHTHSCERERVGREVLDPDLMPNSSLSISDSRWLLPNCSWFMILFYGMCSPSCVYILFSLITKKLHEAKNQKRNCLAQTEQGPIIKASSIAGMDLRTNIYNKIVRRLQIFWASLFVQIIILTWYQSRGLEFKPWLYSLSPISYII